VRRGKGEALCLVGSEVREGWRKSYEWHQRPSFPGKHGHNPSSHQKRRLAAGVGGVASNSMVSEVPTKVWIYFVIHVGMYGHSPIWQQVLSQMMVQFLRILVVRLCINQLLQEELFLT